MERPLWPVQGDPGRTREPQSRPWGSQGSCLDKPLSARLGSIPLSMCSGPGLDQKKQMCDLTHSQDSLQVGRTQGPRKRKVTRK